MRRLHLVRHGRSRVDRALPAHRWGLDPAGLPDIASLRGSGVLPPEARWFSSPETKALETARLLTATPVTVVDALREHVRDTTAWCDDFPSAVRRAFDTSAEAAVPGWEPLDALRDRMLPVVRRILADAPAEEELVLVGHGTAWTVLVAELTGAGPDLDAWERLRMPDHWVVDLAGD